MWPWDYRITEALDNDYRRAFLLASIQEIDTEETVIIDLLANRLPDFMKNIIDCLGVYLKNYIVNYSMAQKQDKEKALRSISMFKSLTPMFKEVTVPDGKGGFITVRHKC